MGEIKAKGGDIETVEGEVVAGDAGDVDVVSIKGNVQIISNNISLAELYLLSITCNYQHFQDQTLSQETHVIHLVQVAKSA